MKSNKNYIFYILSFALFLGLAAPTLFSDGMFMDGLIYSALSKNMSLGIGSFWKPHLSDTLFPQFFEHPPFAIALQSLWFKVFGNSIFVERFYSLTTFLLVGIIIVAIWKEITNDVKYGWVPLFLWGIMPDTSWAVSNNMLENTMSVFVSLSVWLYLLSLKKQRIVFVILAALSLFLALFSKGFTALYIWSFPFFIWLLIRKRSFVNMTLDTVLIIIFTVLPAFILFHFSVDAAENMTKYFDNQVVGSIQSVKTVDTRFAIFGDLFNGLMLPLIVAIIVVIIAIKKGANKNLLTQNYKWVLTFLFLSLSGVAPIMISMKQRSFYILTVYPFLIIVVALTILPMVKMLFDNINFTSKRFRNFSYAVYGLLTISIVLSVIEANTIGRDVHEIEDCYLVVDKVGENSSINICENLRGEWSLHGYFSRYGNVSLYYNPSLKNKYYLINNDCSDTLISKYNELDIGLKVYSLFERKEE